MAETGTILVGTVGQGVLRSTDDGETWRRLRPDQGMHSDAIIRRLATHPKSGAVVFAGSDKGLLRSDDAGASWQLLDNPMTGQTVWAVAIDESKPDVVIAGTGTPSPARLFRSTDGGASWRQSRAETADSCPAVGVPRPTGIAIDPTNSATVWCSLEVDGVRRSTDGGETWEYAAEAIGNPDAHNVLVTPGPPKRVFIIVNNDVWLSDDDGGGWRPLNIRRIFPWHYPRGIAMRPDDPRTIFITIGDATPGRVGAIMRSCDAGDTWQSMPLSAQSNSAMWTMAIFRSSPDKMLAGSRYGHLYRSDNGGDSWVRLWREFSEISSLAWVPDGA